VKANVTKEPAMKNVSKPAVAPAPLVNVTKPAAAKNVTAIEASINVTKPVNATAPAKAAAPTPSPSNSITVPSNEEIIKKLEDEDFYDVKFDANAK